MTEKKVVVMINTNVKNVLFKDEDFRTASQCRYPYFCVGVAIKNSAVAVRNTNDATKTTLQFTTSEWHEFVNAVKRGEFDAQSQVRKREE